MNKILIPILRQIVPNIIANEIIGVQPMYNPKFYLESGISFDPCNEMPEWYWIRCRNAYPSQYNAMHKFCEDTFGIRGERWTSNDEEFRFLFTYEQDQMMFLLKWAK